MDTRLRSYLENGFVLKPSKDLYFKCTACQMPLGANFLTDGSYVWIEGYEHYIYIHDYALSEGFLSNIKQNDFQVPILNEGEAISLRTQITVWPKIHPVPIDQVRKESKKETQEAFIERTMQRAKATFTKFNLDMLSYTLHD